MDLSGKGWCIFGPRGSGKSWLLEHLLDTNADHIVYDPMGDHYGYRQYIPDDRASIDELSDLIEHVVIPTHPAIFAVDECNKFVAPKPRPLPRGVDSLMDFGRHYGPAGISFGCVARRPAQFHSDVVELADALFLFGLQGKNDYHYLEDLHRGLGDAVRSLPRYHYVSYSGQQVRVHDPIDAPRRRNGTIPQRSRF